MTSWDRLMYVDGQWVEAQAGGRFDVYNPATGDTVATVPAGERADIDRAVAAARRVFDSGSWWPRTAPRERGRILLRAAEIIRRESERLALLETVDCGKPLDESRADLEEVAFIFEYYGGWATKIIGEMPPVGPDALSLVTKEPVGVVAAITPWNYPLMLAVQKVAPALAAGCTVVLKPAEQTPLSALELPSILEEAGLPHGVLHVVTGLGSGAGAALVAHPGVDKVSFTGSREVGKAVLRESASTLKRTTVELGGKSPNIVFSDADFDAAMTGTCNGIFWNQGEICSAGSRVFIERSIYDDALGAMIDRAREVRLGDGKDPETTMGPLVSAAQRSSVERYLEIGATEAKLVFSGERPRDSRLAGGYFVPPTIFADVSNEARIAKEEIFGPVMTVIPFSDVEEVVALANNSEYGLAAAVWTTDLNKALRLAQRIRSGTIWVNDTQASPTEAPWGGFKQSGIGRECGPSGVEDYLELKHIFVRLSPPQQ